MVFEVFEYIIIVCAWFCRTAGEKPHKVHMIDGSVLPTLFDFEGRIAMKRVVKLDVQILIHSFCIVRLLIIIQVLDSYNWFYGDFNTGK